MNILEQKLEEMTKLGALLELQTTMLEMLTIDELQNSRVYSILVGTIDGKNATIQTLTDTYANAAN